jgi:hypothetical protein
MTRPVGRPSTGVKVQVRIPADDLAWLDEQAERLDTTRAVIIRRTISYAASADRYTAALHIEPIPTWTPESATPAPRLSPGALHRRGGVQAVRTTTS